MNIISYNIRGLGRGVKWSSIKRLVTKYQADILWIQETKREQIDGVYVKLCGGTLIWAGRHSRRQIQLVDCFVFEMRRYLEWKGGSLVGALFCWRVYGIKTCRNCSSWMYMHHVMSLASEHCETLSGSWKTFSLMACGVFWETLTASGIHPRE